MVSVYLTLLNTVILKQISYRTPVSSLLSSFHLFVFYGMDPRIYINKTTTSDICTMLVIVKGDVQDTCGRCTDTRSLSFSIFNIFEGG